ncbi:PTS sugar transporter subunit IIB [Enterococcus sp. 669A]|uniref:PTS sugar transporter subunit IIB n=1 Tax=Candidatus Enterococcus moelleringii TaxID=2815325 RepID=A0ABS3L9I4_9ENTE|nr:PTS sugar transporter subunit IIB [Enterococcus sp. 669A]MBO1306280.1 PTS sugar transporter subunit IIB [Enterococcus sp. 669A]
MADIKITRIDFRLIHGQVVTKWMKSYPAQRIVIVDDVLAEDEFMSEIYMMAAPAGVKVNIFSCEEAKEKLEAMDQSVFLLFKNLVSFQKVFNDGLQIEKLVVGGVPSEPGTRLVFSGVYLDDKDFEILDDITKRGISVTFASTPDDSSLNYSQIRK